MLLKILRLIIVSHIYYLLSFDLLPHLGVTQVTELNFEDNKIGTTVPTATTVPPYYSHSRYPEDFTSTTTDLKGDFHYEFYEFTIY